MLRQAGGFVRECTWGVIAIAYIGWIAAWGRSVTMATRALQSQILRPSGLRSAGIFVPDGRLGHALGGGWWTVQYLSLKNVAVYS